MQLFTVPYNQQQNDRSERFNRTIINSAKVILKEAKFYGKFWEDTVSTANSKYIIQYHIIILTNKFFINYYTTKRWITMDLKFFGCLVFYYVPKQLRKKLNNSTSPRCFCLLPRHKSYYIITVYGIIMHLMS
jgi:hypothetical protein